MLRKEEVSSINNTTFLHKAKDTRKVGTIVEVGIINTKLAGTTTSTKTGTRLAKIMQTIASLTGVGTYLAMVI